MQTKANRIRRTGDLMLRAALTAALLAAVACAGSPAADEAAAPAGPAAGSGGDLDPAVAIIIIDGLRPDRVAEADTPNLDRLAETGAFTPSATSVMPTITRTNFVTFATGAYTDEHGLVGGMYIDADWEEHVTDEPTIEEAQARLPVPTIFEAAESEGLRTGFFAMKGYELVGARGARVQVGGEELFSDELWEGRYDPTDGGSIEESVRRRLEKNDVIARRLESVVADQPFDLVLINIGSTDYVAHTQGPRTDHYLRAIEESDAMVARIREIVRRANPDRAWHVIVGADHGFSQTNREQLVVPHLEGVFEVQALSAGGIEHRIYERGGRAAELYLRDDADLDRAAAALQQVPWVTRIYADGDVPGAAGDYGDLRVDYPGRRGSIYVIVDPDYALAYPNAGQHGSDDPVDRTVPIWIAGPSIDGDDVDLTGASNADVGPTALDILGIDPERALEGSGESLLDPEPAAATSGRAGAEAP